jgi:hypothetical protein
MFTPTLGVYDLTNQFLRVGGYTHMNWVILLVLWSGLSFSSEGKAPQACLSYEPTTVTLQGTIRRQTFPGPPNYESVEEGDEPETYWILHLTNPVCVDSDKNMPGGEEKENNVTDVQLGLDERQYAQYKGLLGKQVTVNGRLSHAFTGHHHTAIRLTVAEIKDE